MYKYQIPKDQTLVYHDHIQCMDIPIVNEIAYLRDTNQVIFCSPDYDGNITLTQPTQIERYQEDALKASFSAKNLSAEKIVEILNSNPARQARKGDMDTNVEIGQIWKAKTLDTPDYVLVAAISKDGVFIFNSGAHGDYDMPVISIDVLLQYYVLDDRF